MSDLLAKLQDVFRDVLDNPALILKRESNAQNVDGWDSLAHMNLVSVIEQDFKIRFALGELEDLKNVGDMIDLMNKKMNH